MRNKLIKALGVLVFLTATISLYTGCSEGSLPPPPPPDTSTITISTGAV